jgi:branched-subunit amino acid aminotransferase/4-amino-4-deoxychorismate lyase
VHIYNLLRSALHVFAAPPCCTLPLYLIGVTRDSIIQLARRLGYDVQEDKVSVTEAMEVG